MLEVLSTKRVATAVTAVVFLSLLLYLYSPVRFEVSFVWSLVYCTTVFTLLFLYSTFSKYVRRQRAIVAITAAALVVSVVKDGSRIHIIKTDKIEYIQSYGDYVQIFSEGQKHIKELTMKYLESSLPMMFVRIHRSCIVNSSMISRIEQYGKESYNVHLKNGTCLKASATGYKSLKQFLSI